MRMDDVLIFLSEKLFYLDTNYIYARIFYHKENNEFYNTLVEKDKNKWMKIKTRLQRVFLCGFFWYSLYETWNNACITTL